MGKREKKKGEEQVKQLSKLTHSEFTARVNGEETGAEREREMKRRERKKRRLRRGNCIADNNTAVNIKSQWKSR